MFRTPSHLSACRTWRRSMQFLVRSQPALAAPAANELRRWPRGRWPRARSADGEAFLKCCLFPVASATQSCAASRSYQVTIPSECNRLAQMASAPTIELGGPQDLGHIRKLLDRAIDQHLQVASRTAPWAPAVATPSGTAKPCRQVDRCAPHPALHAGTGPGGA